jgi:GNAT superfamily N-acetyltransferase
METLFLEKWRDPSVENHVIKAVSPDGEIMGYINVDVLPKDFYFGNSSLTLFSMLKEEAGQCGGDDDDRGFPAKDGLVDAIVRKEHEMFGSWLKGKKACVVNGLMTLPKFQRRGVGTALLKWASDFVSVLHFMALESYG